MWEPLSKQNAIATYMATKTWPLSRGLIGAGCFFVLNAEADDACKLLSWARGAFVRCSATLRYLWSRWELMNEPRRRASLIALRRDVDALVSSTFFSISLCIMPDVSLHALSARESYSLICFTDCGCRATMTHFGCVQGPLTIRVKNFTHTYVARDVVLMPI